MKPTTQQILRNARIYRLHLCRGRRQTKAAAIAALRLKAHPHELRREWYRGQMMIPAKAPEGPFEVI